MIPHASRSRRPLHFAVLVGATALLMFVSLVGLGMSLRVREAERQFIRHLSYTMNESYDHVGHTLSHVADLVLLDPSTSSAEEISEHILQILEPVRGFLSVVNTATAAEEWAQLAHEVPDLLGQYNRKSLAVEGAFTDLERVLVSATESEGSGPLHPWFDRLRPLVHRISEVSREYLSAARQIESVLRASAQLAVVSSMQATFRFTVAAATSLALLLFVVVLWGKWERDNRLDLDRAATAADSANRLKNEFLANVSHELRNRLNGLSGMISLLAGSRLGTEQRRHLSLMDDAASLLSQNVERLLEYSKIEAGEIEIVPSAVKLMAALESSLHMATQIATDKGLAFHLDAPPTDVVVGVDSGRLNQIVLNLLTNAVAYTELGEVRCTLTVDEGRIEVDVTDTGIGISEADLGRIFESNVRLDPDQASPYTGSGIGLAVTRGLVDAMDGYITVESTPGQGSCFSVSLPLCLDCVAESDPESSELPVGSNHEKLAVLIVEDEFVNRLYLKLTIEQLGHSVAEAATGKEALELISAGGSGFDVCFVDIGLPGMSGIEVARSVRNTPRPGQGRTALVALTAHARTEDREACLAAGFDVFVTKPASEQDISRAMTRLKSGAGV